MSHNMTCCKPLPSEICIICADYSASLLALLTRPALQDLDYGAIQLSTEDTEKLVAAQPSNLAQAQRIPGVTPAAMMAVLLHIRRQQRARA